MCTGSKVFRWKLIIHQRRKISSPAIRTFLIFRSLGSLRDVSKESDHERLIYLLIGRALCGEPKVLLQRLAMFARAPCQTCLSKLKSSLSEDELQLE